MLGQMLNRLGYSIAAGEPPKSQTNESRITQSVSYDSYELTTQAQPEQRLGLIPALFIQECSNLSDSQRADRILALSPRMSEPGVVESVIESLALEHHYTERAWAAIDVLLHHDNQAMVVSVLLSAAASPRCTSALQNALVEALQKLCPLPGILPQIVTFLRHHDWHAPLCKELFKVVVCAANQDGTRYIIRRLIQNNGISLEQDQLRRDAIRTFLRANKSHPNVRAYLLEVFSERRDHSWLGQDIVNLLAHSITEPSVSHELINALLEPEASATHAIISQAFCNEAHNPAVYSVIIERLADLLNTTRDGAPPTWRLPILRALKVAAKNPGVRAEMATCFIIGQWSERSETVLRVAFRLLSEFAYAEDVESVYAQLLRDRDSNTVLVMQLADLPARNAPRPPVRFTAALPTNAADARLFFAALFAVEERQRRSKALLSTIINEELRTFNEPQRFEHLCSVVRSSAPGKFFKDRNRTFVWAMEAALAPPHYVTLAPSKRCVPFTCIYCFETKDPHEAVELACCTDATGKPLCIGCAHDTVLQSTEPRLKDKCPTGCGNCLALQDLNALMLPKSRSTNIALRINAEEMQALPGWRPCSVKGCIGGGIETAATPDPQCLVCEAAIESSSERFIIRRTLEGLGPIPHGTNGNTMMRSAYCCGVSTEKGEDCSHMSCRCGGQWDFTRGPFLPGNAPPPNYVDDEGDGHQRFRPLSEDILSRLGFYDGIPHGCLSPEHDALVQQRRAEWLASGRY